MIFHASFCSRILKFAGIFLAIAGLVLLVVWLLGKLTAVSLP